MTDCICPLDGKPCLKDCPDRFRDREEGGCVLTIAAEMGATILTLDGNTVGVAFLPDDLRLDG